MLLIYLVDPWWNNPQYSYGLLVPFLCLGLLWHRRKELTLAFAATTQPVTHSHFSRAFLFLGALALLPIELLRQASPQLRSIGIFGTFLCLALTFWTIHRLGLRRLPSLFYGTALLFITAIPWPSVLELWITQSLMNWIAGITADILNVIGVLAIPRGNLIELKSGVLSIDEACSGVRSLQSCIMVSIALGQFFCLSKYRAGFLLVCGILLALIGNFIRTLILTLLASSYGLSSVEIFHDSAGWGILICVTLALYFFTGKLEEPASYQSLPSSFPTIDWGKIPTVRTACALGFISVLVAHLWYWSHDAYWPPQEKPFLTLNTSPNLLIKEVPVPHSVLEILRPQHGAYYRAYSSTFGEVTIFTFFWSAGSDSLVAFFHRPDICMAGAGWQMTDDVHETSIKIANQNTAWNIFSFQRDQQKVLQAWGVWRDGIEQKLDFSKGWSSAFGKHMQIWHYIREGRRTTNIEIVSVSLDTSQGDEKALRHLIQQLFATQPRGEP